MSVSCHNTIWRHNPEDLDLNYQSSWSHQNRCGTIIMNDKTADVWNSLWPAWSYYPTLHLEGLIKTISSEKTAWRILSFKCINLHECKLVTVHFGGLFQCIISTSRASHDAQLVTKLCASVHMQYLTYTQTFYVKFVGRLTPSFNVSLFIAIKRKPKCRFRVVTMLFHTLHKVGRGGGGYWIQFCTYSITI
jgi:hypothetical protein